MRNFLVTMTFVCAVISLPAFAGCGTAGTNHGKSGKTEPGEAPAAPSTVSPSPAPPPAPGLAGAWENGSCGERKYRRRIEFFDNGRFAALDEVAPCPPGARCVWSGIIRWQGTWSIEGRSIAIAVEPVEGEKLPEVVPGSFEFIAEDPPGLAERIGDLVCPYRRID